MSVNTNSSVEHIVLLNVKAGSDPSDISAMEEALDSLRQLDMVKYLTTGPVHRCRSPSLNFTHLFRSKFLSKDDLDDYAAHPAHLAVSHIVSPLCDNILVADWVAEGVPIGPEPKPGSAIRVQIVKLKEGLEEAHKGEVLEVVGTLKENLKGIVELSFGENFAAPEHAKGFSIAWTEVYPGLNELNSSWEGVDVEIQNAYAKVREYFETYVLVDYVVPSPTN